MLIITSALPSPGMKAVNSSYWQSWKILVWRGREMKRREKWRKEEKGEEIEDSGQTQTLKLLNVNLSFFLCKIKKPTFTS